MSVNPWCYDTYAYAYFNYSNIQYLGSAKEQRSCNLLFFCACGCMHAWSYYLLSSIMFYYGICDHGHWILWILFSDDVFHMKRILNGHMRFYHMVSARADCKLSQG